MLQKFFVIGCFLFTTLSVFSQDENWDDKKSDVPLSIYVKNDKTHFLNTSFVDDLKLKGFKFLIFNDESLMSNTFTIDLRNLGRQGTQFSYESYKNFDLHRHIPNVPDIITLHRFNNSNATIQVN